MSDDMALAGGKHNLLDFVRIIHFRTCFTVVQLLFMRLFWGH
jgi:Ni,Fe-hydrogenase I cytochrome b subunit